MGRYPRRRFHSRSRLGGRTSWIGYFKRRRGSVAFLGLFSVGLFMGSIYTVRDCGREGLILTMVTNHIQNQATSGYWQILSGCLVSGLGYIIFLYFAANCVQGRWLSNLVPVFYGLSVGARVTALLYQHGFGAGGYVVVCVLIPRFFQFILLLSACGQAARLSQSISAQKPIGEQNFLLLGGAAVVLSMAESLVLSRFTYLLTYL